MNREADVLEAKMVVIADITLLPGDISGKARGYASGVRPNHYFPQLCSHAIGQISFLGCDKIEPGETRRARVEFMAWPALRDLLVPGTEWEIREAANIVGRGRVLTIVSHEI